MTVPPPGLDAPESAAVAAAHAPRRRGGRRPGAGNRPGTGEPVTRIANSPGDAGPGAAAGQALGEVSLEDKADEDKVGGVSASETGQSFDVEQAQAARSRLVTPIIDEERAYAQRVRAAAAAGDAATLARDAAEHAQRQTKAATTLANYGSVLDAALSNVPMDERLGALLEGTRVLLGSQVAAILLMDEKGDKLWPRASLGFETTFGVMPVAVNGTIRQIIRTGRAIVIPDVQPDAEFRVGLIEEGIHSLAAAPIRINGQREGVLICGHRQLDRFDMADAQLLQVIADQMGSVLKRGRNLEAQTRGRREAERASQFKTELFDMATHDIKTPLSTLTLQLGVLADPRTSQAQREHSLDVMKRNMKRLTQILDDFLDLARIEASRLTINPSQIRVADLLDEAAEVFAPLAEKNRIHLRVEPAQGTQARGDPQRVFQVMSNLVSNAIRYSPPGSTIWLRSHAAPDHVEIHVIDDGRGMTAEQLALIFQPFIQVHEAPGNSKGSGLGLYISKAIVAAHGGRLWLRSPGPGKGTDAAFTLPCAKAAPPGPAPAGPEESP